MYKTIFILIIFVLNSLCFSQIKKVEYKVNTISSSDLYLYIYLDEKQNENLPRHFKSRSDYPKNIDIQIIDASSKISLGEMEIDDAPGGVYGNNYLLFKFAAKSENAIKLLIEGNEEYYIGIDKDIILHLVDSVDTDLRLLIITPEILKNSTLNKLRLSQDQIDLLVKSKNGESFFYDNYVKAGKQIETDDLSKTNYVLSFGYHSNLIKYISWSVTGRVSTKTDDPLDKFQFFPFNYNYFGSYQNFYFGADAQLGIESNQKFTMQRMNITGDFQTMIPNLVDFTNGANRLRLKPLIKFGLKGLFEYKDLRPNMSKANDTQLFTDIYYYIPIFNIYSIVLEYNAFNIFKGQNSGKGWNSLYKFTLGVEIPKTDFKVIAKYERGENDINYKIDSQLIIGLMMDFFK